ncbi:hypothetical protein I4U23_027878 [Adineta vaga]|nr:hypothetical protein I4U23_027878 [Adineta vaga]
MTYLKLLFLLHTFKFCFDFTDDKLKINENLAKCQEFETTFWYQHHWFVNYGIDEFRLFIYTTPYIRKEYKLFPSTENFLYNFNDENAFDNVTQLTLYENLNNT